MKRYHSTLGPFLLQWLGVTVLGYQAMTDPRFVWSTPSPGPEEALAMTYPEPAHTATSKRAKRLVGKMLARSRKNPPRPEDVFIPGVLEFGKLIDADAAKEVLGRDLTHDERYVLQEAWADSPGKCEECGGTFKQRELNGEPYGRICEGCYWEMQT